MNKNSPNWTAKYLRRKVRKHARTQSEAATAFSARELNESGRKRNEWMSKAVRKSWKLGAEIDTLIEQLRDNPTEPPNAKTTAEKRQTQNINMGSLNLASTLQASDDDVAAEMIDGLDDAAETEMKRELRNATINGTIPTAIMDTGASSTCVQPAE